MIQSAFGGLAMLGIALGIYHLFIALDSIFLFREGEEITSWIAVISGPFSTLPLVIFSIFRKKIGGILLIAGGTISLIALTIGMGLNVDIVPFFLLSSIPMIIIGVGFLLIRK